MSISKTFLTLTCYKVPVCHTYLTSDKCQYLIHVKHWHITFPRPRLFILLIGQHFCPHSFWRGGMISNEKKASTMPTKTMAKCVLETHFAQLCHYAWFAIGEAKDSVCTLPTIMRTFQLLIISTPEKNWNERCTRIL